MNDQIKKLMSDMNTLATGKGELWRYESLAEAMTQLAAQKREALLSTKSAEALILKLFSEPDNTQRGLLAEELRQETLDRLHDLRWSLNSTGDQDLPIFQPIGERLVHAYTMLNACAAEGKPITENDLEEVEVNYVYDENVQLKFVPLSYDHNYLIDRLIEARLISNADGELFRDILDGVTLPYEKDVHPNWKGSLRSLVTFVILGSELGLFKIEWKIKYQKGRKSTENTPKFESAIINTFLCDNKPPYIGISRQYIKPIQAYIPRVLEFMKGRNPKAVKLKRTDLKDELDGKEIELEVDFLCGQFPELDIEILQIYDDLLSKSTITD